MKIGIIGLGYVGLANALVLSQKNSVIGYDINPTKINDLQIKKRHVNSAEIERRHAESIIWTTNFNKLIDCELIIVATPTDYNHITKQFDTSSIDINIDKLVARSGSNLPLILIKSTIPVGYVSELRKKYGTLKILFSPEFLREDRAVYDITHPSRIVIGCRSSNGKRIANLFLEIAINNKIPIILTDPDEAEAIKLFSNTYLAMRVAFFNELDAFMYSRKLRTFDVIKGVSSDPRIGDYYNNPSFGYGGYCLPKDVLQLQAEYDGISSKLVTAIIDSNNVRKRNIANDIIKLKPKVVGIYRLIMKSGSDNFRQSVMWDIIGYLKMKHIKIKIYEPILKSESINGCEIIHDIDYFIKTCDLVIANRMSPELIKHQNKIFTRDLFHNN